MVHHRFPKQESSLSIKSITELVRRLLLLEIKLNKKQNILSAFHGDCGPNGKGRCKAQEVKINVVLPCVMTTPDLHGSNIAIKYFYNLLYIPFSQS